MALLAIDVSLAAFRVLKDTTHGAEGVEAVGETAAKRELVTAVAPETPRLLPAVHVLWQPLMAALNVSDKASLHRCSAVLSAKCLPPIWQC